MPRIVGRNVVKKPVATKSAGGAGKPSRGISSRVAAQRPVERLQRRGSQSLVRPQQLVLVGVNAETALLEANKVLSSIGLPGLKGRLAQDLTVICENNKILADRAVHARFYNTVVSVRIQSINNIILGSVRPVGGGEIARKKVAEFWGKFLKGFSRAKK